MIAVVGAVLIGDDGNLHDVHEYEVQSGVSPEFSRIHSSEFDSEAPDR